MELWKKDFRLIVSLFDGMESWILWVSCSSPNLQEFQITHDSMNLPKIEFIS